MRSTFTLAFASAAFAGFATARIVGLAAPAVIAPNDNITVTLITENYIQTVKDLSAAFGLAPQVYSGGFLGVDFLGEFYLGPSKSNVLGNLTFTVTTPSDLTGINYLTGIVNSLYGASNGAVTYEWAVPVTLGTTTSTQQNSDTVGINGNCFAGTTSSSTSTSTSSSTISTPTATTTPRSANNNTQCFPASTQSSIQSALVYADALINNIVQGDNSTGQQNLGELNGFLGDVFRAVDVYGQGEAACNNPAPPAWPPLSPADSQARAIDILRNAQSALQTLSGEVLQCDDADAFGLACTILRLVDNLDSYYTS